MPQPGQDLLVDSITELTFCRPNKVAECLTEQEDILESINSKLDELL